MKLELAFLGQVTRLCLQFYIREVEMVDQQPEGLWCPLRGSSSTDRGLPTTAGRLPSFPQSFPECFAATCPFKTSQLARWLLANIATSRLQCRKPSLLKVVNKPALQIARGATRRCGLSEGGSESGRRAGWSLRVVSRPKLCFHNLVSLSRGQPLLTPPLSSLTRLPSLYISHFTPCFCAKCYGTH